MNDEQLWELRGILNQIQQSENDCMAIGFDRKITESRKRDLLRRLDHVKERIEQL